MILAYKPVARPPITSEVIGGLARSHGGPRRGALPEIG